MSLYYRRLKSKDIHVKQNDDNIISSKPVETTNGIHHPARLRAAIKSRIDYGRDRDVDVEGVNDFMMWYENFQSTNIQLPTLSR